MHTETTASKQPLAPSEWRARIAAHERRVSAWVESRILRTSRGQKHPVYDFLFTYYSHRPSLLRRWSPGIGVVLEGEGTERFLRRREFTRIAEGVTLDSATLDPPRLEAVDWIARLLKACRDRPARLGCYGLHEWAMVYEADEVRHDSYPLRFSRGELGAILRAHTVCCSHYDAYRFFTPAARSLNQLRPRKETRTQFEQKGCLHTNMDLYKWSYKLAPWTPSELVADAFELACRIREADMRASPYDLRSLGFEPIKIETPDGKREYDALQRKFSRQADPIRERLLEVCLQMLREAGHGPFLPPGRCRP